MDLLFLGGNVMTMDRSGTRAEALAVRDGKIAAVGATEEISDNGVGGDGGGAAGGSDADTGLR